MELERFGTAMMQDVCLKLHEYTAEHEELDGHCFELLAASTTNIERKVIEHLDLVADSASKIVLRPINCGGDFSGHTFYNRTSDNQPFIPVPPPPLPTRWQHTKILPETQNERDPVDNSEAAHASPGHSPTSPCYSPSSYVFNSASPCYSPVSPSYSPNSPTIPQLTSPQGAYAPPRSSPGSNAYERDGPDLVPNFNPYLPSTRFQFLPLTSPVREPSLPYPPLRFGNLTIGEQKVEPPTTLPYNRNETKNNKPPSMLRKRGPPSDGYAPRPYRRAPNLPHPERGPSIPNLPRLQRPETAFEDLQCHNNPIPVLISPLIDPALHQEPNSRGPPPASVPTGQRRNDRPVTERTRAHIDLDLSPYASETGGLLSSKEKRKRRKGAGPHRECANCLTRFTPESRRGPSGQRNLCNICGLRSAKQMTRSDSEDSGTVRKVEEGAFGGPVLGWMDFADTTLGDRDLKDSDFDLFLEADADTAFDFREHYSFEDQPISASMESSPNKKIYVKEGLGQAMSSSATAQSLQGSDKIGHDFLTTTQVFENKPKNAERGDEVMQTSQDKRRELQMKKEKLRQLKLAREARSPQEDSSARRNKLINLVSAQKAPSGQDHNWSNNDSAYNAIPGQPAVTSNHALQDYHMQLMLLEQQNKKRRMIARQERDGPRHLMSGEITPPADPPSSLASTIESRPCSDKPSLPIRETTFSRQSSPKTSQPPSSMPADRQLQDYQEQLAFTKRQETEQRDNDRLSMSKNEEIADEAMNVLLKLNPSRKSRYPVRTTEADKKALQDYQMSLMTLTCGNPKRRMMCRADDTGAGHHSPSRTGTVSAVAAFARPRKKPKTSMAGASGTESAEGTFERSFRNESASFGNEYHIMQDVLQDFDFDSFLQQDDSPSTFNFDPVDLTDANQSKQSALLQPPAPPSRVFRPAHQTADDDDLPLYVNAKQFHRLLKRRAARQKLEEQLASRDSRSSSPDTASDRASKKSPRSYILSLGESDELDTEEGLHKDSKDNVSRPTSPIPLDSGFSNEKDIELAWSHPKLTSARTNRLWWQTYISFIAASSRKSPVFFIISTALETELGLSAALYASDEDICKRVVDNVRPLSIAGSTLHEDRPELKEVLFLRGDVVRMLMTVDGRLGLEPAALGWSCVSVFLKVSPSSSWSNSRFHVRSDHIFQIFNKVLNHISPLCPSALSILETSFSQLQEIVHIIARYAVMENLYQQSITSGTSNSTTLSLKPEYQSSLLSLCSSILEWFAASYRIGNIVVEVSNCDMANVGKLAVLGELDEKVAQCGELMVAIRKKNMGCQVFRVEVDAKDESGNEDDDSDIEDVSDASWEEIGEDEIQARV